ncbi:MOSC domain-containing protein [Haloechinothrix sp. YIM 98757]|uniref:MOSC domain-containing protein n=1 Tax=Haloechinothrix aidingensis TaxID=2752311 RepID=A0A838AE11_9PSEU|nr:MOSC N-terminal beta barrel domain-containing protein [Haloechinothrix aidingensis]MBA0127539.1 MOSC domain-containing protein [Haloechinothrix aidingensis]
MAPRVTGLIHYPVKGCAGVTLERATVAPTGIEHDRRFLIVSAADGRFLSQRGNPAMALIRPAVLDGGARLSLALPGRDELVVDVDPDGPPRTVTVHSWEGTGIDQGDSAASRLSEALGEDVRLCYAPESMDRSRTGRFTSTTHFADAYPILLASQASLDTLTARLGERGSDGVPMNRFRPNIVVDGWDEPHTEDRVDRLGMSGVELGFEQECTRCTIPLVDQETGRKDGPEPIRTLADYRRGPEGGVIFAANYAVLTPGAVSVGDTVTVHSWLAHAESSPS